MLTPNFSLIPWTHVFFHPHILQPTRITDHSATLIDSIFFNSIEHITICGNVVYDLSDHLPNFIILNRFSDVSSNTKLYRRDYSNFNRSAFLNDVRSVDCQSILECDSYPSIPIWIFATFWILPALWRFSRKSPISPKSPVSKGPLLASNSNRQRLAIFRHFRHCMHFWT